MDYPDFYVKGPTPCSQVDPDDFFADPDQPNSIKTTNAAKKVCANCPYIVECLEWALENNEQGVWGGTTRNERRRLRKEARLRPIVLGSPRSIEDLRSTAPVLVQSEQESTYRRNVS